MPFQKKHCNVSIGSGFGSDWVKNQIIFKNIVFNITKKSIIVAISDSDVAKDTIEIGLETIIPFRFGYLGLCISKNVSIKEQAR